MSMFKKYEWYHHHGISVMVRKSLKGKHWNYCMCFDCLSFIPDKKINCPASKELYKFCKKWGMVTPVFECPNFLRK